MVVGEPQGAVGASDDPLREADAGIGELETTPAVVILPMEPFAQLVNQSAPSGPTVMPSGSLIPGPV